MYSYKYYVIDSADNIEFKVSNNNIEAFRVKGETYKIWKSDHFEKIDDVFLFDYDNDNKQELIVLYWRYGDYLGQRDYLKPIVGDDKLSQHINIYKFDPYIHLVWGGSSLNNPIVNLQICSDNKSLLCADKSDYKDFPIVKQSIKLKWNQWWWEEV